MDGSLEESIKLVSIDNRKRTLLNLTFIVICWNVGADGPDSTQTVSRNELVHTFTFGYFHTNVVILGTRVAQVADTTPIEVFSTTWSGAGATITPNRFACGNENIVRRVYNGKM
jgi:hypothetical protein